MKVERIQPLCCPRCQSTRVKAGFTKKVRSAFVRDGKIWCYDCMKVTDTKTGKAKTHDFDALKFE